MSKSNSARKQQIAQRRAKKARNRSEAKKAQVSSHNVAQETATWEAMKEIYDNVVNMISVIHSCMPYLNDPELKARINMIDAVEGVRSIENDILKHVAPELNAMHEFLVTRSGKVKDEQVFEFAEAYERLTALATLVHTGITPQTEMLMVTINDAALLAKHDLGIEGIYIPAELRQSVDNSNFPTSEEVL